MKRRNLLCAIACFGLCVCLLCVLLTTAVAAIDTPYVPLLPDSETTGKSTQSTDTGSNQPETTEEVNQPSGAETDPVERAEGNASEQPSDPDETTTPVDPATEFVKKHGCKSTVSGAAVCCVLLASALCVKRKFH